LAIRGDYIGRMPHLPPPGCRASLAIFLLWAAAPALAQLPMTEIPPIKRVLPPEGIEIPSEVRARLDQRVLEVRTRNKSNQLSFSKFRSADVEVFAKAVEFAVRHREFYSPKDFDKAEWALDEANKRLDALDKGDKPWEKQRGLVVRGYRTRLDESVQPYGLVIPADHDFQKPCPLYVWLHGRGDKQTDLHFLYERATKRGQIAPPDAIVLHPFGRHCVGFKHAGEVDVLEAIYRATVEYKIDEQQVVLIGFSMGGAGAWHIGAHHAHAFAAVAPGAGFAETARYQNLTPDRYPPEYEQKLWGMYDAPNYVRNLFNTEVIAYSGELDKQIQAARVMEEAYKAEGRELTHLIGPGVEHKYEPQTLENLQLRLRRILATTDPDEWQYPDEVDLQTRTLQYAQQKWITAEGLDEHWQDSRIHGLRTGDTVALTTKNVNRLSLKFPGRWKLAEVTIDGQAIGAPPELGQPFQSHGGQVIYRPVMAAKADGKWKWVTYREPWERDPEHPTALRKVRNLQGPIDYAYMGRFLVVEASPAGRDFRQWCEFEIAHFRDRWRALMRGEPQFKRPSEVTISDLDSYGTIVLWGDPESNSVMDWLLKDTPLKFDRDAGRRGQWQFGGQSYEADSYVPALVYPRRHPNGDVKGYLVLNSGLTFREGHDHTNSLQNPKLPDWAIIDITQPPDAFAPGRIHDAGFFDENWQLRGLPKGPGENDP
jgi:dienelactone hydrolase